MRIRLGLGFGTGLEHDNINVRLSKTLSKTMLGSQFDVSYARLAMWTCKPRQAIIIDIGAKRRFGGFFDWQRTFMTRTCQCQVFEYLVWDNMPV